ncbi:Cytochrome b5 heme-binding domain-containing protein [Aphelenchoides fujianensis]|nr:Cytochrome b5 heme-binding domain-containing protein [Aphelenchoides fujianensis]
MADLKTISLEEVAKHNTTDSCWIALNGKVYDVTKFIEEHPGGEDVLLREAGTDATAAFEDVGHSSDALEMTAEYLIGLLAA